MQAFSSVKQFFERFGQMLSRLVLTLLYFVFIAPVAFAVRFSDPLHLRQSARTNWQPWLSRNEDVHHARRQW